MRLINDIMCLYIIYVTTPTNILVWQQAITITLELYSCCKANIERRTLLILAVYCLWLTYSIFIHVCFTITDSTCSTLWQDISQVKVQYTATPI